MDLYGIVGYPLGHSFSPHFFAEKFQREGINAEYVKFEIPEINLFSSIIDSHENLKGLNVTIPYKELIIPFLDEMDAGAEQIKAVNVIKVIRGAGKVRLKGYNSDVIGFCNSISPMINNEIHKKALILGTGGASKAVAVGLKSLGVSYTYVSRTAKEGQYRYQDLDENIMKEYTVIVNSSPVGTFPNVEESPDIPYEFLTSHHLLYDLVYNPAETRFLQQGRSFGAKIKNGAEMLELQALAAWEIWNNK